MLEILFNKDFRALCSIIKKCKEKEKESFKAYYNSAVAEYNDKMKNGHKHYLKKGERILFMGQDITAEKHGYVVLYGANRDHIDYLDELAVNLGLNI